MVPLTHKGWFLLCPIYLGGLDTEAPTTAPRRFIPDWWLDAQQLLFEALVLVVQFFDPDYEPMFPLLITGELPEPLQ